MYISDEGLFGILATRRRIKVNFLWPGINTFVEHHVRMCKMVCK